MLNFKRLAALAAVAAIASQLTGCAQMALGQPKATMENASKLRGMGMAPVAVGSFTIDPAKGKDMDSGATIRGNSLASPINGSFAEYLGESLKVELQSAGLLDPAAATTITGKLTASEVNGPIGTGTARLAARFVVTRASVVEYDRELMADTNWESPFVGAVAIPMAAGQYEGLYRKLVGVLLDDAAFRKAVSK